MLFRHENLGPNIGVFSVLRVIEEGVVVEVKYFVFPGGEVHLNYISNRPTSSKVAVQASIKSSNDLMALMLLSDTLQRQEKSITLELDYLPYARQDRVCTKGDPFSLRVLASMLNSCKFTEVVVSDPHSNVSKQLVDRMSAIPQLECLPKEVKRIAMEATLVSPDKGATLKTLAIANMFNSPSVSQAHKVRDPKTGNITATTTDHGDYFGQTCLIIDDICDGGRTFIELAKVLKERNAGKVILHVTHGIFSKGKEPLLEHIDEIYATYDWTKQL